MNMATFFLHKKDVGLVPFRKMILTLHFLRNALQNLSFKCFKKFITKNKLYIYWKGIKGTLPICKFWSALHKKWSAKNISFFMVIFSAKTNMAIHKK